MLEPQATVTSVLFWQRCFSTYFLTPATDTAPAGSRTERQSEYTS